MITNLGIQYHAASPECARFRPVCYLHTIVSVQKISANFHMYRLAFETMSDSSPNLEVH